MPPATRMEASSPSCRNRSSPPKSKPPGGAQENFSGIFPCAVPPKTSPSKLDVMRLKGAWTGMAGRRRGQTGRDASFCKQQANWQVCAWAVKRTGKAGMGARAGILEGRCARWRGSLVRWRGRVHFRKPAGRAVVRYTRGRRAARRQLGRDDAWSGSWSIGRAAILGTRNAIDFERPVQMRGQV